MPVWIAATAALVCGAGTARAQGKPSSSTPPTTRVSAASAAVHARCDEASPVRIILGRGETVTILALQENWAQVRVRSTSEEGCMRRSLLERTPAMDQADAARRARQSTAPAARRPSGPPAARGLVSVNFGWQSVSDRFTDTKTFELYQETARYSSEYDIESNTTFDIGGAAHIWRGLGAGVAVTRFEDARDIAIEGTLPHPFFFRTDRAVSGTTPGTREELATHVSATYFIPAGRRMQVVVFGGPSIFNVQQTVVTELKYTQQFPYDSVAFSPPTVVTEKETKVGYHVGADVAYYFSKVVGAGGIVRFSRASVPFSLGDRDAGGVSVGGGLRLRFP